MEENIRMIAWEKETLLLSDYTHAFAHLHDACEVVFVLDGEIEASFSDRSYRAARGDLIVFGPLEVHRIHILRPPYRRIGMRISRESLLYAVRDPSLSALYTARPSGFTHLIRPPQGCSGVLSAFESILRLYKEKEPFYLEAMEAMLGLFTILLYRACPHAFPASPAAIRSVVYDARLYLDEHFMQPISIEALARMFFMSHSYFTHAFRDLTGCTPKQYLNLHRLAHARKLLKTTRLSMDEIAEQVCFADSNAFIRAFKKEFGITPGVFRRVQSAVLPLSADNPAYLRRMGTLRTES